LSCVDSAEVSRLGRGRKHPRGAARPDTRSCPGWPSPTRWQRRSAAAANRRCWQLSGPWYAGFCQQESGGTTLARVCRRQQVRDNLTPFLCTLTTPKQSKRHGRHTGKGGAASVGGPITLQRWLQMARPDARGERGRCQVVWRRVRYRGSRKMSCDRTRLHWPMQSESSRQHWTPSRFRLGHPSRRLHR
jgi:hypothetical protein